MENYFEFYEIEEKFFLDEKGLKQLYFQKSKDNHPDLFIGDDKKYEEALELTSLNNAAYNGLKKLDSRIAYLLKLKGILGESGNKLPQSFLMEMMDVNEAIMELQFENNSQQQAELTSQVNELSADLKGELHKLAKFCDEAGLESKIVLLNEMKDIYLKLKYVLRLKESLNTFAT